MTWKARLPFHHNHPVRLAIKALEKAGFRLIRQGKKHVVMTNGTRFLTIPRTMGGIVKDAGLSEKDFLELKRGASL